MNRPKASVYIAASLDGFIARKDGGLDWLDSIPVDPDEDYGFKEFMDSIDALIMGRNTYDVVSGFDNWPYEGKKVIVLSKNLHEVRPEAMLYYGAPESLLKKLQEEGARHVYVDGGVTICRFMEKGLIDRLIITIIPTILGSGIPLFNQMETQQDLHLMSAESYPNGLVQLRYERPPEN